MANVETLKEKWKVSIDAMTIVGKYFETNNDFINVMKTAKRYQQLTQMYHFNPIQDYSLFENMEIQHLYEEPKEPNKQSFVSKLFGLFNYQNNTIKKEGMNQYI